jgi:hypothetical protein
MTHSRSTRPFRSISPDQRWDESWPSSRASSSGSGSHRLLGRLIGVAFALPFVVFLLLMRKMPRRLIVRCAVLLGLGGLQGLIGWWMVTSGLSASGSMSRPSV